MFKHDQEYCLKYSDMINNFRKEIMEFNLKHVSSLVKDSNNLVQHKIEAIKSFDVDYSAKIDLLRKKIESKH